MLSTRSLQLSLLRLQSDLAGTFRTTYGVRAKAFQCLSGRSVERVQLGSAPVGTAGSLRPMRGQRTL